MLKFLILLYIPYGGSVMPDFNNADEWRMNHPRPIIIQSGCPVDSDSEAFTNLECA